MLRVQRIIRHQIHRNNTDPCKAEALWRAHPPGGQLPRVPADALQLRVDPPHVNAGRKRAVRVAKIRQSFILFKAGDLSIAIADSNGQFELRQPGAAAEIFQAGPQKL